MRKKAKVDDPKDEETHALKEENKLTAQSLAEMSALVKKIGQQAEHVQTLQDMAPHGDGESKAKVDAWASVANDVAKIQKSMKTVEALKADLPFFTDFKMLRRDTLEGKYGKHAKLRKESEHVIAKLLPIVDQIQDSIELVNSMYQVRSAHQQRGPSEVSAEKKRNQKGKKRNLWATFQRPLNGKSIHVPAPMRVVTYMCA